MTQLTEVPKPPSIIPTEQELMASWQGNLDEPLLTIKCITYNHVSFIRDALHGFLTQRTDFPFRIVIHDDASTDGTQEIIKEYAAKYPHVFKVVLQETNLFSRGIKRGPYVDPLVAGQYVALCEGDDYWIDPEKLQRQVDFLSGNPSYVASTENAITFFPEAGRFEAFSKQPEHDIDITELLGPRPFTTASAVYRASAIAGRGDALKVAGDIGTWCYLATKGDIKFYPIYSSVYRRGKHGMVLGADRLEWARKMRGWNHDLARFLAHDALDPVFRKRVFNCYKSAFYSKPLLSLDRARALAGAFQQSPKQTFKLVGEAAMPERLSRNPIIKNIQRRRDIRIDRRHLESISKNQRIDGSKMVAHNVVVSLTTSRPRIRQAWMAIESLLQQDLAPERIVLSLDEDEFQRRLLPRPIRKQTTQGLEIIWSKKQRQGYSTALSTSSLFPGCDIVTASDGILYPNDTIRELVAAKHARSKDIVGCAGWVIGSLNGALLPSRLWSRASSSASGPSLLLIPGTGVLFPEYFFHSGMFKNAARAMNLCPAAKDLWFWAVARHEGMTTHCLGIDTFHEMASQGRTINRALGSEEYDQQFFALLESLKRPIEPFD